MSYKLKNGAFMVKCNHKGCSFEFETKIEQDLMGISEEDVENEARELVVEIAGIRHEMDSQFNSHQLTNPEITKISGVYEAIIGKKSVLIQQEEAIVYKEFKKGDIVLKKGDIASTICEVVKGKAYANTSNSHVYEVGDSFGAAALIVNQTRMADIISGDDGTTIAFYNLKELSKKNPLKAKELYNKAMEDIFDIVTELQDLIERLERKLEKEELKNSNYSGRISILEKDLINTNKIVLNLESSIKK